ncbi:hypothetical protein IMZ48_26025 [Candidatus Bathyarchaeota archaeon]|nr:hypothetical protein [Candidatus Bathyarchaeota archaeon]
MDSFVLSLLLALFFNLALASSLRLGATPGSPCAAICNTAVRDDTFICKGGDLEGTGLEGCLTCLQGSEYMDKKDKYLAERRFRARLPLTQIQHNRKANTTSPYLHQRSLPRKTSP